MTRLEVTHSSCCQTTMLRADVPISPQGERTAISVTKP